MKAVVRTLIATSVLTIGIAVPVGAGVVVYEKDEKKVEIGDRIQLQYLSSDPPAGPVTTSPPAPIGPRSASTGT